MPSCFQHVWFPMAGALDSCFAKSEFFHFLFQVFACMLAFSGSSDSIASAIGASWSLCLARKSLKISERLVSYSLSCCQLFRRFLSKNDVFFAKAKKKNSGVLQLRILPISSISASARPIIETLHKTVLLRSLRVLIRSS